MPAHFEVLPGLPGRGDLPIPCPAAWGRHGHEGLVVRFTSRGGTWVGNFAPSLGTKTAVLPHPDGRRVLVIANGALYEVDPAYPGPFDQTTSCITEIIDVPQENCYVFALSHIGLICWGARGRRWYTGRISWDGFQNIHVDDRTIRGEAWRAPIEDWVPFEVDLETGSVRGGAEDLPDYRE